MTGVVRLEKGGTERERGREKGWKERVIPKRGEIRGWFSWPAAICPLGPAKLQESCPTGLCSLGLATVQRAPLPTRRGRKSSAFPIYPCPPTVPKRRISCTKGRLYTQSETEQKVHTANTLNERYINKSTTYYYD